VASSIPYDHPSLVLGNIVDTSILNRMKKIGSLQAKTDAAMDKLNSHIAMKRSLGMMLNELVNLNIDVADVNTRIAEVDTAITQAAVDYMTVRLANETGIQQLREEITEQEVSDTMESPIDYTLSSIKRLPLSSESLKLDAQYFSYGSNEEDASASIENYIRESTRNIGAKSDEVAKAATEQIRQQRKNHSLAGTLIITASCTHRNVAIIEPFILDVDKAIQTWNAIYRDEPINVDEEEGVQTIAKGSEASGDKSLSILSGVAYGSSFVGMVHILNKTLTDSASMVSLASDIQGRLKIGSWLEDASGGFGVDSSIANEVKNLLSTQNITSHISVIVMGVLPSIASKQLSLGLSKLVDSDSEKMTNYLSAISAATSAEAETLETGATGARTGARLLNMQSATIKSVMQGLDKIDQGANQMLDINSMMAAFENYLDQIKAKDRDVGVPVSFYLKNINRKQLAKLWLDKYYPDKEKPAANNVPPVTDVK
jgi:hypothetical protein